MVQTKILSVFMSRLYSNTIIRKLLAQDEMRNFSPLRIFNSREFFPTNLWNSNGYKIHFISYSRIFFLSNFIQMRSAITVWLSNFIVSRIKGNLSVIFQSTLLLFVFFIYIFCQCYLPSIRLPTSRRIGCLLSVYRSICIMFSLTIFLFRVYL